MRPLSMSHWISGRSQYLMRSEAAAVAPQRRLDGRVLAPHDDHALAEVPVRLLEEVAHVGQLLPRHAEPPRAVHVPDGQHDAPGEELLAARLRRRALAAARLLGAADAVVARHRREHERTVGAVHPHHALARAHPEVELLDHRAQVGQVLLPCRLRLVRDGERHARDLQPLGAREDLRARRPPLDGRPDLAGLEVLVRDARALQRDRELEADRPGPDDGDVGFRLGSGHGRAPA
jgi:hypothetical protein